MMDVICESYMEEMAKLEHCWQSAVDEAMSARENQLATAHKTIIALQEKLSQQDDVIKQQAQEVKDLQNTVSELTTKYELVLQEKVTLQADAERRIQEGNEEFNRQLSLKEREMEEAIRFRQYESTKALTIEVRNTIHDLEAQLDMAKSNEVKYEQKIAELDQEKDKYEKCLKDWDKVSKKMCVYISDLKSKLNSSRFAKSKLKEEISLWKQYSTKLGDEINSIKREAVNENIVLNKLNEMVFDFKSNNQCPDMIIDAMNEIGRNIIKAINGSELLPKSSKVVVVSVESQTDNAIPCENKENIDKDIQNLRTNELRLENELKTAVLELESIMQQNMTLKEVIKSMRKEREQWKREKEQIEEEVRVAALEDSVKLLKNSVLTNQKDKGVLTTLQHVKKQVSNLINSK